MRIGRLTAPFAVAALAAAASAQSTRFAELRGQHLPANAMATQLAESPVVAGDFDGDGDIDLIGVLIDPAQRLALMVNDGHGRFTASQNSVGDPTLPQAITAGDVDGDGDLDLVFGEGVVWQAEPNALLLNDGFGNFSDVSATQLPGLVDPTASVALVDVDGDDDLDLYCGNLPDYVLGAGYLDGQDELYLNDGNGTFAVASAALPVDIEVTNAVATGDVDGDGDIDVVCASIPYQFPVQQSTGQNRLYLNDGSGSFTDASHQLPPDSDSTHRVVLADVDNDTDLDLLVGNGSQNRIYLNDGSGNFTDATAGRMPPNTAYIQDLVVADIESDGDLDVLVAYGGDRNRIYFNNGLGVFTDDTGDRLPNFRTYTLALAPADFDGDGDIDLHWTGGLSRLFLNDGTARFHEGTRQTLPVARALYPSTVLPGDVDGDGDDDLLWAHGSDDENELHLNDGFGRFGDGSDQLPFAEEHTQSAALGDIDGDGDLDLILGHDLQNEVLVNDGAGNFADETDPRMPVGFEDTEALALGDIDADGDLDLLVGNSYVGGTDPDRLFLNDGGGVFTDVTAAQLPPAAKYTNAAILADVDGDQDLDAIFGDRVAANRLYANDGAGNFVDVSGSSFPGGASDTTSVALGDVDRDGDPDLVWGNIGQNQLWLNDGHGVFSDATAANLPADNDTTFAVVLGDVDEDGDLDLVCGNTSIGSPPYGGQDRLYLNDGAGVFREATTAWLPTGINFTTSLLLHDTDRDGDLDLAAGHGSFDVRTLYTNLRRQIAAPYLMKSGAPYPIDLYANPGSAEPGNWMVLFVGPHSARIPLEGLGILGVDPHGAATLRPVRIPAPSGKATVSPKVVDTPALLGSKIYWQGLLIDQAGRARFTNTIEAVVL